MIRPISSSVAISAQGLGVEVRGISFPPLPALGPWAGHATDGYLFLSPRDNETVPGAGAVYRLLAEDGGVESRLRPAGPIVVQSFLPHTGFPVRGHTSFRIVGV